MAAISERCLIGPPASSNKTDVTRRLATTTDAHAQSSHSNLQDDANGAESLPIAHSGIHDSPTGTAGSNTSATDNQINEGKPSPGPPSSSQGFQTSVPDVDRPKAEHSGGPTNAALIKKVDVTSEDRLHTDFKDDDLAKQLGRKVLEYQRYQRLLQQAIGKRNESLARMGEAEKRIFSEQTTLESMRAQAQILQYRIKEKEESISGMQGSLEYQAVLEQTARSQVEIVKMQMAEILRQLGL
ncbi:hypothetical protein B0A49_13897 [Cryomyces minteri]|uniref:Uncharacterized protein n=1 Tax=Cryomyces minteri TaxID=331657 RepID=A0A4V5ND52_9PEZI|nr:hypothetical protein B0A49_13897 [Cryomyces minteri]